MLKMKNNILKYILLFFIGGYAYCLVEILYRGYTHISMLVAGGIGFLVIDILNTRFEYKMSIISKMLISALVITLIELIAGIIVNIWLNLNVWDYSNLPYNFMGQICLLFTNIWFLLSFIGILFSNFINAHLFGEERKLSKIF